MIFSIYQYDHNVLIWPDEGLDNLIFKCWSSLTYLPLMLLAFGVGFSLCTHGINLFAPVRDLIWTTILKNDISLFYFFLRCLL